MAVSGRVAAAPFLRGFFLLLVFAAAHPRIAAAPAPRPPDLAQVGKPSAEDAADLVEKVRSSGIPVAHYLDFELRSLPRRGETRVFVGRLWGSPATKDGAITRVELTDAAGAVHRLLLQNGERARVWRAAGDRVVEVSGPELLAPLIPGLEVSAFDLQMPFLYWPNPEVERVTRVIGRPAHAFRFTPPPDFAARHPEIGGVRAYLDAQFNAIVQIELLGRDGRVAKTMALLSLKTIDRQTLPKALDYRNEITRDKTRLQLTGAALDIALPDAVFDPVGLTRAVAPPPGNAIVRID
jgi:hypothetical protein